MTRCFRYAEQGASAGHLCPTIGAFSWRYSSAHRPAGPAASAPQTPGRMIVMALRTAGHHRYRRTKNNRSLFLRRTRPGTLPLQYGQLMPERRVLCRKPTLRLERRGEQGQEKA